MSGIGSIIIGAAVLTSIFDGGLKYRRASYLVSALNNLDKKMSKADLANCSHLERVGTFRSNGSIDFDQKSGSGDAAYRFRDPSDSRSSDVESDDAKSDDTESDDAESDDAESEYSAPKIRDPEDYRKALDGLFSSQPKKFPGSTITDFLHKSRRNTTKMHFDGKLVGVCQWLSHPSIGVLEKTDTFVQYKNGPTMEPLYKLVPKSKPDPTTMPTSISQLQSVKRLALPPADLNAWKVVGSRILGPAHGTSAIVSKSDESASAGGASAGGASAYGASAGGASAGGASAVVSKSSGVREDILYITSEMAHLLCNPNRSNDEERLLGVYQIALAVLHG